jgi:hypothetical protein
MAPLRTVRIRLQAAWAGPGERGLLGGDPRVRTLRRVLVTYPHIRHVLPDRLTFESDADPRMLETVAKFLERQQWLVGDVEID